MFNLSRIVTLGSVARNFGVTKKLFASTSVLAEKNDSIEPRKQDLLKKAKSQSWDEKICNWNFDVSLFLDPTVAAVFASLNETTEELDPPSETSQNKANLDEIINNAKTVNGLLTISESQPDISRKHALKVLKWLIYFAGI